MSEDERPGDDEGQEELIAGFAALGGPLTGDELLRLLGSDDEYYGALVRLAALLLDGDAAAAEDVIRDALAALQDAPGRLADPDGARVYLRQAVVNRSRFVRLLGSDDEYYGALVRLATLLLDGDAAAAEDVIRDALAALQDAWGRLGDPDGARVYLRQAVVNRSRSVRRHWAIQGHGTPSAGPGAPAAGYVNRDPWACALRALPDRQREAVVLRTYLSLSEKQAAEAMGISAGAVRSHLARGVSSLQRPAGPR
jgi:DNA-directed RNA polymerase specialized sigma24 family protein